MLDFEKINKMIDLIEDNQVMEGLSFNEFAMEFYSQKTAPPILCPRLWVQYINLQQLLNIIYLIF